MAKLGQAQEPSMEEILASIRRIISDDDQKTAAPAPASPKFAVVDNGRPEAPPPASVITVPASEMPRAAAAPRPPQPEAPRATEAPVLASAAPPVRPPEPPRPETRAPVAESPPPLADHEPEILELSEADAALPDDELDASDIAFVEPPRAAEPPPPPRPRPTAPPQQAAPMSGESPFERGLLSQRTDEAVNTAFNQLAATFLTNQARTLEDIVKEMMRPMLKSWLDDNLPPLVERLVREEIERVSRGRR